MEEMIKVEKGKKKVGIKLYLGLVALLVAIIVALSLYISMGQEEEEVKPAVVSFKNIGILQTQETRSTVVDVIKEPREIWNLKIPFTTSEVIYSFDVVVKAGVDFEKINWEVQENKIVVSLEKAFITDSYIEPGSHKYYHENENLFRNISHKEQTKSEKKKYDQTVEQIKAAGLLDRAQTTAETVIKSFFVKEEQYKDYTVEFQWIEPQTEANTDQKVEE